MNADHKKRLRKATEEIEAGWAKATEILQEMRDKFDDLSEKAQEGEKGQALNDEAETLESHLDDVERGKDDLYGMLEKD